MKTRFIAFFLLFVGMVPAFAASSKTKVITDTSTSANTVPFVNAAPAEDATSAAALGVQVNSTEMMRVTATGSVGIGTTTPLGNIDIENVSKTARACLNGSCVTSFASSGSLLQNIFVSTASFTGFSTGFSWNGVQPETTIPTITEGASILTASITPLSASSIIEVETEIMLGEDANTTNALCVALFQNGATNAIAASWAPHVNGNSGLNCGPIRVYTQIDNASLSALTFQVRAGAIGGNPWHINGCGNARVFGTAQTSWLRVREYQK